MRLDKLLCECGYGTRSEVKKKLKDRTVTVNDKIITDGAFKADFENDIIKVNNKIVQYEEYVYYVLNKPQGVVSATRDNLHKTVVDLIENETHDDIFPVGRLDIDTEGLLIITNDGQFSHKLMSPKKKVDKVYYAIVDGMVTDKEIEAFSKGLDIDEEFKALPASLTVIESGDTSRVLVKIHEGKFHQVKRMFQAVGMKVLYLERVSIGNLKFVYHSEETKDLYMGTKMIASNIKSGDYVKLKKSDFDNIDKEIDNKGILDGIEGVIFDLDGTLIDSMWMWKEIDREYLGGYGIELPEDLQSCIEGKSFSETAVYFKERFNIPESLDDIKDYWNEMAFNKYKNEVPLKNGVMEFLTFLKEKGIKTGIATSNSKELVSVIMDKYNLSSCFDSVRTACEVEKGKPFPDIYLKVAEDIGVNPAKCLVFEDVLQGVKAGIAAGMRVCAVSDIHSQYDLAAIKREAHSFINDFKDLL